MELIFVFSESTLWALAPGSADIENEAAFANHHSQKLLGTVYFFIIIIEAELG